MTHLKTLRKQKGLRLRHIAEMVCSTPQTVWKHEQYGIKTARIAKRYAAALGCDWRELLD